MSLITPGKKKWFIDVAAILAVGGRKCANGTCPWSAHPSRGKFTQTFLGAYHAPA